MTLHQQRRAICSARRLGGNALRGAVPSSSSSSGCLPQPMFFFYRSEGE